MARTSLPGKWRRSAAFSIFLMVSTLIPAPASAWSSDHDEDGEGKTATPIKHVIVLIGENHTFDNIYATYVPRHGSVSNLLSRGIIRANGSPGPNAGLATQFLLQNINPASYFVDTRKLTNPGKAAYSPFLPTPEAGFGPPLPVTRAQFLKDPVDTVAPFDANTFTLGQLHTISPEEELGDLFLLTTGATGLTNCQTDPTLPPATCSQPDTRITNFNSLANTSFQITGKRSRMTATPATWCTASTTCGSNPIAACWMRLHGIPLAARMTYIRS